MLKSSADGLVEARLACPDRSVKVTTSWTVELALTNQIAPAEQANQIGGPTENQDHGLKELIVLWRLGFLAQTIRYGPGI